MCVVGDGVVGALDGRLRVIKYTDGLGCLGRSDMVLAVVRGIASSAERLKTTRRFFCCNAD